MLSMAKASLTVRINMKTRENLDAIAETLDRDRSYVVNEALEDYIDTHRWQLEHIRQGLRQADARKFVSPAEMKKIASRMRPK
jgi:predicted transcriptional regulator